MLERRALRAGPGNVGGVRTRLGLRQVNVGEIALIAAGSAALHEHGRVDAEEPHQPEDDEDADDADAAAAARAAAAREADAAAGEVEAAGAAFVAPVLDVLALSSAAPAHGGAILDELRPDCRNFDHCA